MPKAPSEKEEETFDSMKERLEENLGIDWKESLRIDSDFLENHAEPELRKLFLANQLIEQALENNQIKPEQADWFLKLAIKTSLAVPSSAQGVVAPRDGAMEILFQQIGRTLLSNPGGGSGNRSLERLGRALTSNPGGGRLAGTSFSSMLGNPGGGRSSGEGSDPES
jgi:hypothetical protein